MTPYLSSRLVGLFLLTKINDMEQRLKNIFNGMKARCYNEKHVGFKHYGARGIGVCPEWLDNFGAFKEWALANGYAPTLTLERNQGDKDYSPTNCTWADWSTQMKNRRNPNPTRKGLKYSTKYDLTFGGVTQNAKAWAAQIGVSDECIRKRFKANPSPEYVLRELVK